MYKVYGSAASRSARVIWMLEELGVEYEIIATKPHSAELKAVSETGKIPALVDGDLNIFDSASILTYLADKHGALTFPAGSPERVRMQSILHFVLDDVEQPLWSAAKHSFILPENLRMLEALTPTLHYEWTGALKTLEKLLGDGPFVMGTRFTLVDIILGHLGGWGKAMKFPIPEGPVAAYFERVRARDGWQKVAELRKAA
jgi:glutathione S-transferase